MAFVRQFLNRSPENNFDDLWNQLFRKTQVLKKDDAVTDPQGSENCTSDDVILKFKLLKSSLNATKSKLDIYEIQRWRRHTKLLHLCGSVTRVAKKEINAELCTQAWVKLCHLLCQHDVFQNISTDNDNNFRTLHLCEAPGAFITCVNHLLRTKYREIKWDWRATTLNPYFEGNDLTCMVEEDCFIKHTLHKWDFGKDYSGDITNIVNFRYIVKKYKSPRTRPALITADGSMNCADNPSEQEKTVFPLLFWELLTGLNVIKNGGHYIFKMFIPCEMYSVKLLHAVAGCFKEVHVTKPGPSKPGNSEFYVVCMDFKSISSTIENITKKLDTVSCSFDVTRYEALLEDVKLPTNNFIRMYEISKYFVKFQTDVIKENIELFNKIHKFEQIIENIKWKIGEKFIKRFDLQPIDYSDHVATIISNQYTFSKQTESVNFLQGSFTERKKQKEKTWIEKLHATGHYDHPSKIIQDLISLSSPLKWYHSSDDSSNGTERKEVFVKKIGDKVTECGNSKFSIPTVLGDLCLVFKNSPIFQNNASSVISIERQASCMDPVVDLEGSTIYLQWLCKFMKDFVSKRVIYYGNDPLDFKTEFTKSGFDYSEITEWKNIFLDLYTLQPLDVRLIENGETLHLTDNTFCYPKADCIIWLFDKYQLGEQACKEEKIKILISICTKLEENGNLILRIGHTHSYFTVGLIYLLSLQFERFCITTSPMEVFDAVKFITFVCFKGLAKDILEHLLSSLYTLRIIKSSGLDIDVLHIVSIEPMIDCQFEIYMKEKNVEFSNILIGMAICSEKVKNFKEQAAKRITCEVTTALKDR